MHRNAYHRSLSLIQLIVLSPFLSLWLIISFSALPSSSRVDDHNARDVDGHCPLRHDLSYSSPSLLHSSRPSSVFPHYRHRGSVCADVLCARPFKSQEIARPVPGNMTPNRTDHAGDDTGLADDRNGIARNFNVCGDIVRVCCFLPYPQPCLTCSYSCFPLEPPYCKISGSCVGADKATCTLGVSAMQYSSFYRSPAMRNLSAMPVAAHLMARDIGPKNRCPPQIPSCLWKVL